MIWAVIVTRDRLALLEQCLEAVRAQARRPDRVLVVDNASSDGTAAWLAEQDDVEVLRLEENVGGAGGFHAGLERAHREGAEWMWLMDDDTIPRPDALEALLRPGDDDLILRASVAVWK
nr:glycosyltransferase [Actinomycetota bacterium]